MGCTTGGQNVIKKANEFPEPEVGSVWMIQGGLGLLACKFFRYRRLLVDAYSMGTALLPCSRRESGLE
jgi:hypothetical protein